MVKGCMVDENMSNLTSASSEISASSGTKNDIGSLYPQFSSTSTNQEPLPKKKRSLPGHPDPDAEVIALTPKTLMATNRFICEICNKGFQRDQNLQLHRRGHNLPWKLKQRNSNEIIRKKVYVCPEPTCVHHDPSRALGDLTGIKKHFCRKHGEKKWKCERCSKRYAVQSDWKAHSKICGTREYKCDCGTLFSRRDSFITHRAFCDVLAQESARANVTALNPLMSSHTQLHINHGLQLQAPSSVKREEQDQFNTLRPDQIPPWLACPPQLPTHFDQQNPNPTTTTTFLPCFQSTPSPHMSATALLQKASQIGVTVSKTAPPSSSTSMLRPHMMQQQGHVPMASSSAVSSGMVNMQSREETRTVFSHGLAPYGNKAAITASDYTASSDLFHDMMGGNSASSNVHSASGFESLSFDEAMRGMFNPPRDGGNFEELVSKSTQPLQISKSNKGTVAGVNDEMTRDFMGLGAFSDQRDFFNISGLDHHLGSSSYGKQNHNQAPWHG